MDAARAEAIKDVNVRYHDAAADSYDAKWSILYDEESREQVVRKLERALGEPLGPLGRSLEIGAGTGYFTLNLAPAGLVERPVASDISGGMLEALGRSAELLGIEVETARCEAAEL